MYVKDVDTNGNLENNGDDKMFFIFVGIIIFIICMLEQVSIGNYSKVIAIILCVLLLMCVGSCSASSVESHITNDSVTENILFKDN